MSNQPFKYTVSVLLVSCLILMVYHDYHLNTMATDIEGPEFYIKRKIQAQKIYEDRRKQIRVNCKLLFSKWTDVYYSVKIGCLQ